MEALLAATVAVPMKVTRLLQTVKEGLVEVQVAVTLADPM